MTKLSFCPHYLQEIIWVAELKNGKLIREWEDDGKEKLFKDIPLDELKKFHLIGEGIDYFFDCKTGEFVVDRKTYVFPLCGEKLNYGEGLIHYKEASQEFMPHGRNDYSGFRINGYQIGWKVIKDDIKCQILFTIPDKIFNIQLTFLDINKTVKWKIMV